jgi:hypothetical protein
LGSLVCFYLSWRPSTSFFTLYGRTFLGDRLPRFILFKGSKNFSWRPSTPFFTLYGLQGPFLATVHPFFYALRAPRTFLGDRLPLFLRFTGPKDLSWRPAAPFFTLYGLQGPFLATVYPVFYSLRAPRTFLGDRPPRFLLFTVSKNLSWRPSATFFTLYGLHGRFPLEKNNPMFDIRLFNRTISL